MKVEYGEKDLEDMLNHAHEHSVAFLQEDRIFWGKQIEKIELELTVK